MSTAHTEIPPWVVYPEEEWVEATPDQAGFDAGRFKAVADPAQVKGATWEGEVHGPGEWGSVLTRGGYLVRAWGNPVYCYQTASVGKAFSRALIGLAVREGLIDPDEVVRKTWTGEGELAHEHKYLDQGHHKTLTWRHLVGTKDGKFHCGGFPVTNGFFWRKGTYAHSQTSWGRGFFKPTDSKRDQGRPYPEWAQWTGDPDYDNYAHAEPGTVECYSSGGIWRLNQALTALWGRDIKEVLDEKLFGPIGIRAERWDWTPGQQVHDQKDFYPTMPGYGDFVDPPYAIDGHVVRGGGGWAKMCAKDLARFALLVATGGIWRGERLLDDEWVRSHGGGNGSNMIGDPETFIGLGIVTTEGLPSIEAFKDLVAGPISRA